MRKLTFAMNVSLDGYIAAPGDDLGWSVPSDELFQWWSDRVDVAGLGGRTTALPMAASVLGLARAAACCFLALCRPWRPGADPLAQSSG